LTSAEAPSARVRRRWPARAGALLAVAALAVGAAEAAAADNTSGSKPAPAASAKPPPPPQPAQPQAQPKAAAPAPAPAPRNVEPVPAKLASGVLGKKVQGPKGEDMGLVVDVIVDAEGRPWALVIDFGGFLGVGSRKIAIDWRLVHFKPDDQDAPVLLRLGRDEIQVAPEYDPAGKPPQMVGPPKTDSPTTTNFGK
jgi:hypothetical protein